VQIIHAKMAGHVKLYQMETKFANVQQASVDLYAGRIWLVFVSPNHVRMAASAFHKATGQSNARAYLPGVAHFAPIIPAHRVHANMEVVLLHQQPRMNAFAIHIGLHRNATGWSALITHAELPTTAPTRDANAIHPMWENIAKLIYAVRIVARTGRNAAYQVVKSCAHARGHTQDRIVRS
jgi:hypothetical protein